MTAEEDEAVPDTVLLALPYCICDVPLVTEFPGRLAAAVLTASVLVSDVLVSDVLAVDALTADVLAGAVLAADATALDGAVLLTVLDAVCVLPADDVPADIVPRPPLVPAAMPTRVDTLPANTLSDPVLCRGPRQRLSSLMTTTPPG